MLRVTPQQCDQIWRNFANLAKSSKSGHFLRVNLLFGEILTNFGKIWLVIGQVFVDANGQMLTKNVAIKKYNRYSDVPMSF